MSIRGVFVGTAGIPNSTKRKNTVEGIKRVAELGLSAMELEFVRGINLSSEAAIRVREVAKDLSVALTAHAPYFINLLSDRNDVRRASAERIVESAKIAYIAGARSVVFHSGYYGRYGSEEAVRVVRETLKQVVKVLEDMNVKIWVRPETMGGLAEVGSLEEVLSIVEGIDMALPAVDFAHIHARSIGRANDLESFRKVLEEVEKRLGSDALKNSHIHMSGIEYGERGERAHLNFDESRFNWLAAVEAVKEFKVEGVIISESPNLEEDALKILSALRA
ncbi:MAG: TIM barrel protein [Sulfolobales archaeon]|nr:TIM barrel protein [Sulfolobales archaeon]MCX8209034.1 TIM barrel protein [Sulfolobales archaeon]MDW8010065.1 TIM barrel protein [Sulfolobales archaeon]